jgi:branched-subunit amino acid transport protein
MSTMLAVVLLGGAASWLLRASFLVFLGPERIPAPARRMLAYALPTFLAAILVDSVAAEVSLEWGLLAPQAAALAVAALVAWRTGGLAWTLVAGIGAFAAASAAVGSV